MSKPLLLRLHRWLTLVFALPLAVILVTGLILSVEPIVQTAAIRPGAVTAPAIEALLQRVDPAGQARMLAYRPLDDAVVLMGPGGAAAYDLATGAPAAAGSRLADLFMASRRLHEHLVFEQRWLVTASTIAMLVIAGLGILMGLPRLANTVSGWHKGTAWFLLPLVILSPLTGLALAFGITFTPAPQGGRSAPPPSLIEAVRLVGQDHDLSGLSWIRQRGPNLMARLNEDGEYKVFTVTRAGVTEQPRNWPRLIHEGTVGLLSSLANVVTSVALVGLMGTGLVIWLRRKLRPRRRTRPALTQPA